MRREYTTARSVLGFLEFVSWTALVVGILGALAGASVASRTGFGPASTGAAFAAALPGLALALLGLLGAVQCQIGRAGVDTAEMTGKMLDLSEEQMRLLRAAGGQSIVQGANSLGAQTGGPVAATSASAHPAEPEAASAQAEEGPKPDVPAFETPYKGYTIVQQGRDVFVEGKKLGSTTDAMLLIDSLATSDRKKML
jgi:hypothetical protein